MEQLSPNLRELGRVVGEVSDATANPHTTANVRKRLLQPKPPEQSRVRYLLAAMAAAAMAVLVVWGLGVLRPQPITFTALMGGDASTPGVVGDQLATEQVALALAFSDGSRVKLEASTRARVTATSPQGADILLESGTLHATISSEQGRRQWHFRAGPYTVEVTGTEFDASWEPNERALLVVMQHGSVVVRGPDLRARTLTAGERLDIRASDARAASVEQDEVPVPQDAPSEEEQDPAEDPAAGPSARPTGSASAGPTWRELAAAGKYREAMTALDGAAFSALLQGASAAELRRIADIARFGGQPGRAQAALLAMRAKGVTGDSAFLLGKINADQLGGGAAARWFQTYLAEAPNGPLAEQALGRLLQLNQRNATAARSLAEQYLQRYPQGAYAALARRLRDAK